MRVENWIAKLEAEINAQQQASEQEARRLILHTQRIRYNTTPNTITETTAGGSGTYNSGERFYVTLRTNDNKNTLGILEMKRLNNNRDEFDMQPKVHQVPFSGGIRWMIINPVIFQINEPYRPTEFDISVHSMSRGTLTMEEVRS